MCSFSCPFASFPRLYRRKSLNSHWKECLIYEHKKWDVLGAYVWDIFVTFLNFLPYWGEYTLGYNDFNNLVMQNLWWVHNYILRYIHKKRFSVFLSRFLRICSQRSKKVLILKKSKKVPKNAEFHADFESVEKVLKKCTKKKLLAKTWRINALFFTFTHVRQTCFAYNFFLVHFFTTFLTDSKSAWISAFFDTLFDFV